MSKKPTCDLSEVDYHLQRGKSLAQVAKTLGVDLETVQKSMIVIAKLRDQDADLMSLKADYALEIGLKNLVRHAESLIPQISLGAARELCQMGLMMKRLAKEMNGTMDSAKESPQNSLWEFRPQI